MRLSNARVAGRSDVAVDLDLTDGVISAIGDLGGGGVDLEGRWVIPGLWDNHVHFSQYALQSRRLDISAAESAAETARLIRVAAESGDHAAGPIIAVGFRDALWPDAPNVADLDAASTHPIVVVSGDLHAVWLNSAALTLYGHAGHPTGLLREDDAFEVTRQIDQAPDARLDAWVAQAERSAARRGVVGIVDYEMTWNLDAWTRRQSAGADALRVEFGVYTEHLDRAIELGLHTGDRLGELLTMGNFKILIDGSLNTRTAFCDDDYAENPGERGMLTVDPATLVELMTTASSASIEPSVHAIGDRANSIALDAFAAVGVGGRIEHAQFVADRDLPRFSQLGVAASVQPDHALDDRDVAERHWAGRTNRAFPLRSLLDHGAKLLFGSDAPVSPLDPWVTIGAAVSRTRGAREPWHPEQRVSVAQAIEASTRSIVEVDQPADLVIVEQDPYGIESTDLAAMPVSGTLLAGRFTYGER